MTRRIRHLVLLLPAVLALLSACSGDQIFQSMISPEDDRYARDYLAAIERGDTAAVLRDLDPALSDERTHEAFARMMAVFRDRRTVSATVVGVQRGTVDGVRHTNLSYELRLSRGWALANVATRVEGGRRLVEGASVTEMERSLADLNAFRLAGRSGAHYVVLAMAVVIPLVMLTALFLVFRLNVRRRWLWVLAAILAIGKFSFNWSTGEAAFQLANVQLLGAGWFRSGPVAPVIIVVSFPLGALWIIGMYLQQRRAAREQPAEPAE